MYKIIIVEDDHEYRNILKELLATKGYHITDVASVMEAYRLIKETNYDLVITDLKMDDLDGFQLIELLKTQQVSTKIIMLTNSTYVQDEISGLDLGIDDYINKAGSFQVLLKRIDRILTRDTSNLQIIRNILKSEKENLELYIKERTVLVDGENIKLSYIEFELLKYLLTNRNVVLTRKDIITNVWGTGHNIEDIDERSVDTHIKNLRLKTKIRSIQSIRTVGYKWDETL